MWGQHRETKGKTDASIVPDWRLLQVIKHKIDAKESLLRSDQVYLKPFQWQKWYDKYVAPKSCQIDSQVMPSTCDTACHGFEECKYANYFSFPMLSLAVRCSVESKESFLYKAAYKDHCLSGIDSMGTLMTRTYRSDLLV